MRTLTSTFGASRRSPSSTTSRPASVLSHPCRYEPDLNRSYLDFATHSGTAVVPARVAKPRDKAKVETAVQVDMAGMRTEGCLAGQEENVDAGGSERSEWALSSSSHISLPASRSVCDSGSMFRAPGPLSPHGPARSAAGRG